MLLMEFSLEIKILNIVGEILSNVVDRKFHTSSGTPLCNSLLNQFSVNKLLVFKYQKY